MIPNKKLNALACSTVCLLALGLLAHSVALAIPWQSSTANSSNTIPRVTFFVTWDASIQYTQEHIGAQSDITLHHSSKMSGTGVMHYSLLNIGGHDVLSYQDGYIRHAQASYAHRSWNTPSEFDKKISRAFEYMTDGDAGFMGVYPTLELMPDSKHELVFGGDGVAKIHHYLHETYLQLCASCGPPDPPRTIEEDVENPFIQSFWVDWIHVVGAVPDGALELKPDDNSQSSFSVHFHQPIVKTPNVQGEISGAVDWNAHAYVSKCSERGGGPIGEGDPAINHEDVAMQVDRDKNDILDVTPFEDEDDSSQRVVIKIAVSCDEVPIQNAVVEVSVKPKDDSGGHIAGEHTSDRPRGYLNKQELTAHHPSIKVTSGADGKAEVIFEQPFKGEYTGTYKGHSRTYKRGIAGIYEVTAKSLHPNSGQDTVAITSGLKTTLTELQSGPNYVLCCATEEHPQGFWGTKGTLQAFTKIADDITNYQSLHNAALQSCKKNPWLHGQIQPLSVNDIALPTGGLFDLDKNWKPGTGHYSHNRGEGGDFNRFGAYNTKQGMTIIVHIDALGNETECDGSSVPIVGWLLHVLLDFGQPAYGKWDCKDLGWPAGCGQEKYPEDFIWGPPRLHLHVDD